MTEGDCNGCDWWGGHFTLVTPRRGEGPGYGCETLFLSTLQCVPIQCSASRRHRVLADSERSGRIAPRTRVINFSHPRPIQAPGISLGPHCRTYERETSPKSSYCHRGQTLFGHRKIYAGAWREHIQLPDPESRETLVHGIASVRSLVRFASE